MKQQASWLFKLLTIICHTGLAEVQALQPLAGAQAGQSTITHAAACTAPWWKLYVHT
jgi:hypothetical protein